MAKKGGGMNISRDKKMLIKEIEDFKSNSNAL